MRRAIAAGSSEQPKIDSDWYTVRASRGYGEAGQRLSWREVRLLPMAPRSGARTLGGDLDRLQGLSVVNKRNNQRRSVLAVTACGRGILNDRDLQDLEAHERRIDEL